MSRRLDLFTVPGIPLIQPGDDLAAMICERTSLRSGDVLAVTSKVVSKAEGRVATTDRQEAVAGEVERVIARRDATVIARTRSGLVLAAAGVDSSNVEAGSVVLLPLDPDGSARALRERITAIAAVDVAVVITDTAGRAWRVGQTDIAIGCAGLAPVDDHAGRTDPFGNRLEVTAPAIADEVAAAADLVKGKTSSTPVAVLRGAALDVLPRGQHGPGAAALVRRPAEDMFGLGSREAVVAAVSRSDPGALAAFPPRAIQIETLLRHAGERLDPEAAALRVVDVARNGQHVVLGGILGNGTDALAAAVALGAAAERLCALAASAGWAVTEEPSGSQLRAASDAKAGWHDVLRMSLSPRPS